MLSVLIPVYNYSVQELVMQLSDQLVAEEFRFEILLLDDDSTQFANQYGKFENLEHVSVLKSEKNLGRSKSRNVLAEKAQYDLLLFLDCDSLPVRDNFINNYLSHAEEKKVLVGGTRYKDEYAPSERLHWLYGTKRESLDQAGFHSNNFLIARQDFLHVRFDESLTQYGHEDTLLGIHLKEEGIQVERIDNPVFHCGLEDNETFLKKALLAVENAWDLAEDGKIEADDIRLIKTYTKWTNSFQGKLLLAFIRKNKSQWEKICLSGNPR
ncbi:MAG: glycosyltransferase, partial [Cryomorphaceae bacterium]